MLSNLGLTATACSLFYETMVAAYMNFLILVMVNFTAGSLYDPFANQDLEQMKKLVDILHEKLTSEDCQDPNKTVIKTDLLETSSEGIQLEAYIELYKHLVQLIINCRKEKEGATTSKTTSEPTTTTTFAPWPAECVNAINLTESWRLDHSGSWIKPINGQPNCDTTDMINSGRPWFRFSGSAGTKLLNSCPPKLSCGTGVALWSNSTMPLAIGVVTRFTAQGSVSNCTRHPRQVSVMRCSSAPSDFVYKYEDSSKDCWIGFCGMD